jgi:hypothetical protein
MVEGNSAAPITGASMPAGGVGLTGWLSAIWTRLAGVVLASGSAVIGKVGIDQTTDGTTNLVSAKQNGTWNVTNVSGTVSLPTGASTAVKQPALGTAGTASTDVITVQGIAGAVAVPVVAEAGENFIGAIGGKSFDVAVTPTVTNGAYSAGDIVGGLIEVTAGRVANGTVTLQSVGVHLKSAVTSNLTVILFSADPSATTKTDNAAYSLNAADVFKVRSVVAGFILTDHGTPNTYGAHSLNRILTTDASRKFYALILDGTGFTLTSTSDLQIHFTGYQD